MQIPTQKIVRLTIYANILYFIVFFHPHWIPFHDVKSFIAFMHIGSMGHLWYLTAYIEILIIYIIALRFQKEHILSYIFILFVILGLIFGGYNFIFPEIPTKAIIHRSAFGIGLPCFGIGWLLKENKDRILQVVTKPVLLAGVLFILSEVEAFVICKRFGLNGDFLIFTIPVTIVVILCCLKYPHIGRGSILEYIGKKYSADIYIYHILVGYILCAYPYQSSHIYIPQSIMTILIYAGTIGFSFIWRYLSKKIYADT